MEDRSEALNSADVKCNSLVRLPNICFVLFLLGRAVFKKRRRSCVISVVPAAAAGWCCCSAELLRLPREGGGAAAPPSLSEWTNGSSSSASVPCNNPVSPRGSLSRPPRRPQDASCPRETPRALIFFYSLTGRGCKEGTLHSLCRGLNPHFTGAERG